MPTAQIHWLAPTTVLLALGAGVLFALGHHLFYSSLNGQAVHQQNISLLGTDVSSQQINTTAGTVFAFLVNFSLGTALATAYTQLVFHKLMYRKATLETWDATYGALSNLFCLAKVWIWWQFPLLCCLIIIGWPLPLASTITPGTLSVGVAPVSDHSVLQLHVPNVDFVSLNYVANMPRISQEEDSTLNTAFSYEGPSPEVISMDPVPGTTGGIGVIPTIQVCEKFKITDEHFVDSTMIQCQLRNVTYHVSFEYQNGEQNILVATDTISEDPVGALSILAGNGQTFSDNVINGVDCSVLSGVYNVDPAANPNNICLIDSKILKTLSYQAIFEAFEDLVTGSVTCSSDAATAKVSTNVPNTILADTPNLAYLNPALQTYADISLKPLQEYVQTGNIHLYEGLVNNAHTRSFSSLIPTMEQLFQNITVSMMSSKVLQPNLTSTFAPSPVNVTLHDIHDVYVYSAARLWLAYGIAIFFAVVASAIGLWALFATGASYSQDFSTVFRIGRGALMSTEVKKEDMDGKDKLPDYLEKAQVWLRPLTAATTKSKVEGDQSRGDSREDLSPNTQERVVGDTNRGS